MNKRKLGGEFEKQAAEYLENSGYSILEKNYSCRFGEIDLIAAKDGTIVFIEVKYRKDGGSGSAVEAVSPQKQWRICRSADHYMMMRGINDLQPCRFDVIAIDASKLKHMENAFMYLCRNR